MHLCQFLNKHLSNVLLDLINPWNSRIINRSNFIPVESRHYSRAVLLEHFSVIHVKAIELLEVVQLFSPSLIFLGQTLFRSISLIFKLNTFDGFFPFLDLRRHPFKFISTFLFILLAYSLDFSIFKPQNCIRVTSTITLIMNAMEPNFKHIVLITFDNVPNIWFIAISGTESLVELIDLLPSRDRLVTITSNVTTEFGHRVALLFF